MINKRILIYRLGSLGDTVVALPAFHLIARAFPDSERRVLTNYPSTDKEAPINTILEGSDLVHGYITYPLKLRNPRQISELRFKIGRWKPDILVYLAAPRGRIKAFRDALFFRFCGIKTLIGVPYNKVLQENKLLPDKCFYEHEAARLERCLSNIGNSRLDDPLSWDLRLRDHEQDRAKEVLQYFKPGLPFIACSVGTKVDVKNWGQKNWKNLIKQLFQKYNNCGLVLIGSKEEFKYSEKISSLWSGPKLNLCGMLTPRESAAVLKLAKIFIGHDSGPTHIASSVGTPCVAIFSARNKPGVWFPYGAGHKIIYHKTDCFGCGLEICNNEGKKCINSISVEEVLEAIQQFQAA